MEKLLLAGFPLIIMTQNPGMLLDSRYSQFLTKGHIILEVTIPSMYAGQGGIGIFRSKAPTSLERLRAVKLLSDFPVELRVRLDPLIPRIHESKIGQTNEDIDEVIKNASNAGAKMIIAKCMRLAKDVPQSVRDILISYYLENGYLLNGSEEDYVLNRNTQELLISPVIDSCRKHNIAFCSCTSDTSLDETVHCGISHKQINTINFLARDVTYG